MTKTVYILEDERDVAELFERALRRESLAPRIFTRLADFLAALNAERPDLCIVDLGLPDGDAAALFGREIASADAPTIIVSGRGALADKLHGLESGAEDYIVKPVDPAELAARARVVLRRRDDRSRARSSDSEDVAVFAGWRANFSTYRLTAEPAHDGEAPAAAHQMLSQTEAVVLRAFVDAPGRILSRAALLSMCEPIGEELFDRAIDVRVSRLRKKLRDDPKRPKLIKTVYGAGYVFAAQVRWLSKASAE